MSQQQHPLEQVNELLPAMRWLAEQGEAISPDGPGHAEFIEQSRRVRKSADELDAAWKTLHEAATVACGDLVRTSKMFDELKGAR